MTVYTVQSTTLYKRQQVLVYTSGGTFIDVWRDAPLLAGFKEAVNSATTPLRVTLPRKFDSFDLAGVLGARGTIAQGNIVQYWLYGPGLPAAGKLRFQGVIDRFEPQIDEQGAESVTVTITPFDSVLGDSGLVGVQTFGTVGSSGTYVDPVTMFEWFLSNNNPATSKPYASPLTLDSGSSISGSSGVTAQYVFKNQTLLSIWTTCVQLLAEVSSSFFFRSNPNKTITLNKAPATAQHQFVIGQHISAPAYSQDWTQLKNVIQVVGAPVDVRLQTAIAAGPGPGALTVSTTPFALTSGQNIIVNDGASAASQQTLTTSAAVAAGATSIPVTAWTAARAYSVGTPTGIPITATATGSDLATFGYRLLQVVDNRITDMTTAQALANALLALYDRMLLRCTLRIIDYRGDTQFGLGYDIESIQVGDSCQIIDPTGIWNTSLWDQAVWDTAYWDYAPGAAVNQVAMIVGLTYGYDYVDLEVSSLAPNLARQVLALNYQLQTYLLGV